MLCPWPSPSVSPQEHPRELQEHGGGGEVPLEGTEGTEGRTATLQGPVPSWDQPHPWPC